jgi:hypothetical protein
MNTKIQSIPDSEGGRPDKQGDKSGRPPSLSAQPHHGLSEKNGDVLIRLIRSKGKLNCQ